MKIVILDGYSLNPGDLSWDGFKELGDIEYYDRTSSDDIIKRIGDAEIVITNKTPLNRQVFESCQIKYVGVLATGFNVVDIHAAKDHQVVVTNIPSYGTQTVAQHVFALLLELTQRVGHHDAAVKNNTWHESNDFCFWHYPIVELAGKTFGIIGLGRIGQSVAKIAEAFGMKVLTHSRTPKDGYDNVSLDDLYAKSDVISLHCPLTVDTEKMINKDSLNKMKRNAILLNTSRGQLIDEEALYHALKNDTIYAAGIDVLEVEPPIHHHKITELDNKTFNWIEGLFFR
jgi:glycerate dehydrogenase